jgi:hypothetical protein
MAGTPSASKRYKVGIQPAKGSIATLFICAMMQMSGMLPERDAIDTGVEHGCSGASSDYATAHKRATEYASYLVNGRFRGQMYPSAIVPFLAMAGFKVVSTLKTGYTEHVLDVATRAEYGWGSILDEIGDLVTLSKDVRVRQLTIDASPAGVIYNGEVVGLSITDTIGTPDVDDEGLFKILPSKGTIAFSTLGGSPINLVSDLPRSMSIQIANPLDTDTQQLTVLGRGDLPQNGFDVSGTVRGCTVTAANYLALYDWTANKPGVTSKLAALDMTLQSAVNIAGAAVPYSIRVQVPKAEVTLPAFDADGANKVFFDYNWRMVADTATPVTITVANLVTDYNP